MDKCKPLAGGGCRLLDPALPQRRRSRCRGGPGCRRSQITRRHFLPPRAGARPRQGRAGRRRRAGGRLPRLHHRRRQAGVRGGSGGALRPWPGACTVTNFVRSPFLPVCLPLNQSPVGLSSYQFSPRQKARETPLLRVEEQYSSTPGDAVLIVTRPPERTRSSP